MRRLLERFFERGNVRLRGGQQYFRFFGIQFARQAGVETGAGDIDGLALGLDVLVDDGQPLLGNAIRKAIAGALRDAGLTPSDVGHVNANGLSTIADDQMEAQAIYDTEKKRVVAAATAEKLASEPVMVTILDKILDRLDADTMKTGISFDLVR